MFWWSVLISTLVILTILAIWQFWVREAIFSSQNEHMQYIEL